MDSDKEYVEVFDDEGGARDKRGRPAQLRRYKDDAYRSATHTHTHTHRPHTCTLPSSHPPAQPQNSATSCFYVTCCKAC